MTVHVLSRFKKTDLPSIDVTTRGVVALSPMALGPVGLYGGHTSQNVENGWQYSKVYPGYESPEAYWPWAMAGWAMTRASRYPKGKGAAPLYSLWNGEKLDYIEARKRIYIPLYVQAILAHQPALLDSLKQWHAASGDVALLDFDAYDHHALGYSWTDVINDPSRKMGHGFVLAMMLEGAIA